MSFSYQLKRFIKQNKGCKKPQSLLTLPSQPGFKKQGFSQKKMGEGREMSEIVFLNFVIFFYY